MSGANRRLFAMPRGASGAAGDGAELGLAGVSSFAFQGTNGHALLQPAAIAAEPAAQPPVMPAWKRQHIHVLPPAHTQLRLGGVAASGSAQARAIFEMHLGSQTVHAFFSDHRVSGKAIFPGKREGGRAGCCSTGSRHR